MENKQEDIIKKERELIGRKMCYVMLRYPEKLPDFAIDLVKGKFEPLKQREVKDAKE